MKALDRSPFMTVTVTVTLYEVSKNGHEDHGNGHGNGHERLTVENYHERLGTNVPKAVTEQSRYGNRNGLKTKNQL
jgi:hypothetical protein